MGGHWYRRAAAAAWQLPAPRNSITGGEFPPSGVAQALRRVLCSAVCACTPLPVRWLVPLLAIVTNQGCSGRAGGDGCGNARAAPTQKRGRVTQTAIADAETQDARRSTQHDDRSLQNENNNDAHWAHPAAAALRAGDHTAPERGGAEATRACRGQRGTLGGHSRTMAASAT